MTTDRSVVRPEPDGRRPASLARRLAELTGSLLAADSVEGVLQRVVGAARLLVPDADAAGITLRGPDGAVRTPARSDDAAAELDAFQHRHGEGPCLDAAAPAGPGYAYSGGLDTDPAWPRFGPHAAGRGHLAVLSTALLSSAPPGAPAAVVVDGTLTLYSRTRGALAGDNRDVALLLATHASLALRAALTASRADAERAGVQARIENLRRAVDTRTVIGQATGILMARRHLTPGDAFDVLASASQNLNVKLIRLAEGVVAAPDAADGL
ncbi:ANTAR domain-containing protein [Actinomadura parmotrematis]|uniref:ANTAR domain-containing protein n=1 Tax=Actinomadura parmotrematis TaxID=2864039 RepID=A0ABS7FPZ3_9ACTN|nr:ANTAR domain-containing protein [Actinomadura parmotrematis]MBW8482431.1 ANTAR domain-containing protein [Actinomadura parmotrematis]